MKNNAVRAGVVVLDDDPAALHLSGVISLCLCPCDCVQQPLPLCG